MVLALGELTNQLVVEVAKVAPGNVPKPAHRAIPLHTC
jgi:hypothetical protein